MFYSKTLTLIFIHFLDCLSYPTFHPITAGLVNRLLPGKHRETDNHLHVQLI